MAISLLSKVARPTLRDDEQLAKGGLQEGSFDIYVFLLAASSAIPNPADRSEPPMMPSRAWS